jgi:hypothetical protein
MWVLLLIVIPKKPIRFPKFLASLSQAGNGAQQQDQNQNQNLEWCLGTYVIVDSSRCCASKTVSNYVSHRATTLATWIKFQPPFNMIGRMFIQLNRLKVQAMGST